MYLNNKSKVRKITNSRLTLTLDVFKSYSLSTACGKVQININIRCI